MNPADDPDTPFLKELVKSSRQRAQHVKWIDRDGTERLTALTTAEATRLHGIARTRRVAPAEVLRQTAHLPKES
jgi:hypothetical protein